MNPNFWFSCLHSWRADTATPNFFHLLICFETGSHSDVQDCRKLTAILPFSSAEIIGTMCQAQIFYLKESLKTSTKLLKIYIFWVLSVYNPMNKMKTWVNDDIKN